MSYQPPSYPPESAPNQGYPGAYPPYPGYPPSAPGQPPQQYPQQYPSAYPPYPAQPQQPGYPPYQQYAPNAQPAMPYAQPAPQPRRVTVQSNQIAIRSLIFGGLALVITIVGAFFGYVLIGGLSIFPIIYGIMGLIRALRLPGRPGLFFAIGGIVMGGLALLLTIFLLIP